MASASTSRKIKRENTYINTSSNIDFDANSYPQKMIATHSILVIYLTFNFDTRQHTLTDENHVTQQINWDEINTLYNIFLFFFIKDFEEPKNILQSNGIPQNTLPDFK